MSLEQVGAEPNAFSEVARDLLKASLLVASAGVALQFMYPNGMPNNVQTFTRGFIGAFDTISETYTAFKTRDERLKNYVGWKWGGVALATVTALGLDALDQSCVINYDQNGPIGALTISMQANLDNMAGYAGDLKRSIKIHGPREGIRNWISTPYIAEGLVAIAGSTLLSGNIRAGEIDTTSAGYVVGEALFAGSADTIGSVVAQSGCDAIKRHHK